MTFWYSSAALATLSTAVAYVISTSDTSRVNRNVVLSANAMTAAPEVEREPRNFEDLLSLLEDAVGKDNVSVDDEE